VEQIFCTICGLQFDKSRIYVVHKCDESRIYVDRKWDESHIYAGHRQGELRIYACCKKVNHVYTRVARG
jgi:hypothetical protein